MNTVPQTISWNLTRRCNLACGHCYLDAERRKAGGHDELDTAACLGIVDQIHGLNPDTLLILTGGEPLLRPDLEQIVRHAADKDLWVVVGTNGTLLDAARCIRLKEAGLRGVGISIDSLEPEQHDRFRGSPSAWRRSVAGIEAALMTSLDIVIQVSVFEWNREEIPALTQWAAEKGVRAVNFYFLVCTGRGQDQTQLSPDAAEAVYHDIHTLQRRYAGRMLVNAKCAPQYQRFLHEQDPQSGHLHAFPGGCPAGTHYCRIDPTGDVTPCPYLPVSGGNITETPLAVIWASSDVFSGIRQRQDLQGRCGECAFRSMCGGCRARAFSDCGDYMGEDPSCAHIPGPNEPEPIEWAAEATYGTAAQDDAGILWEADALESLKRIPPVIRRMVRTRMIAHAQQQGLHRITRAVMIDARKKFLGTGRARIFGVSSGFAGDAGDAGEAPITKNRGPKNSGDHP